MERITQDPTGMRTASTLPLNRVISSRDRRMASEDRLERAARLFRAVADVSRLRVLEILASGEACVTQLADVLGVGISTVSQQLKVLWTERLINRRRSGKHIFYRLADRHVAGLVRSVLDHVEESAQRPAPGTK